MPIDSRKGGPAVGRVDKFNPKEAETQALAKVESGQAETAWFLPFEGASIDNEECTLSPLKDHPGVFAIVDNALQSCVGYTTNSNTQERPLHMR